MFYKAVRAPKKIPTHLTGSRRTRNLPPPVELPGDLFDITGPGEIVAVDKGVNAGESFRGNHRNAFQGICYAIVPATGPGTISVSASAQGVNGAANIDIEANDGQFVPCSGACD